MKKTKKKISKKKSIKKNLKGGESKANLLDLFKEIKKSFKNKSKLPPECEELTIKYINESFQKLKDGEKEELIKGLYNILKNVKCLNEKIIQKKQTGGMPPPRSSGYEEPSQNANNSNNEQAMIVIIRMIDNQYNMRVDDTKQTVHTSVITKLKEVNHPFSGIPYIEYPMGTEVEMGLSFEDLGIENGASLNVQCLPLKTKLTNEEENNLHFRAYEDIVWCEIQQEIEREARRGIPYNYRPIRQRRWYRTAEEAIIHIRENIPYYFFAMIALIELGALSQQVIW